MIVNLIDKLQKGTTEYYKRSLSRIEFIVLHHSGTETGTAENFARYHVNTRKWPGIAYHYVIYKDGTINQTNHLDTLSYHCKGKNSISVGICLVGDMDKENPTKAQMQALVYTVHVIRNALSKNIPVVPHRAHVETSCPGGNVLNSLIESL